MYIIYVTYIMIKISIYLITYSIYIHQYELMIIPCLNILYLQLHGIILYYHYIQHNIHLMLYHIHQYEVPFCLVVSEIFLTSQQNNMLRYLFGFLCAFTVWPVLFYWYCHGTHLSIFIIKNIQTHHFNSFQFISYGHLSI